MARKEVDYLDILLLLRFISTFTIPSLILSQFLSLLDELLLRLTVHGYYFASSPDTLSDFVFLFLFISTRSHMRNRSPLSLLKSTSLISGHNRTSFETQLRVQTKTYSKFQSSSRVSPNIYFSLLLLNIIVPF